MMACKTELINTDKWEKDIKIHNYMIENIRDLNYRAFIRDTIAERKGEKIFRLGFISS